MPNKKVNEEAKCQWHWGRWKYDHILKRCTFEYGLTHSKDVLDDDVVLSDCEYGFKVKDYEEALDHTIIHSDGTISVKHAAFIARACNSHDELRYVCRELVRIITFQSNVDERHLIHIVNLAKEVLAKADAPQHPERIE